MPNGVGVDNWMRCPACDSNKTNVRILSGRINMFCKNDDCLYGESVPVEALRG